MKERNRREAPLEINPNDFRELGYSFIDQIADFLESLPDRPVTTGGPPSKIRELIGQDSLPKNGSDPKALLIKTAQLLFDHSLFNGHPKFFGYITSSAAPIGALGDLLAAAIKPNVGGWNRSPVASEIEEQAIRWIAELIGYDVDCGGYWSAVETWQTLFAVSLPATPKPVGISARKEGNQPIQNHYVFMLPKKPILGFTRQWICSDWTRGRCRVALDNYFS